MKTRLPTKSEDQIKSRQNKGWLIELLLKSIPQYKRYAKFSMSSGTPWMHKGVKPWASPFSILLTCIEGGERASRGQKHCIATNEVGDAAVSQQTDAQCKNSSEESDDDITERRVKKMTKKMNLTDSAQRTTYVFLYFWIK